MMNIRTLIVFFASMISWLPLALGSYGGSYTFDSYFTLQWNVTSDIPLASQTVWPDFTSTPKYLVFTVILKALNIYGSFGIGTQMHNADTLYGSVDTTNGGLVSDRIGYYRLTPYVDSSRGGTDDAHLLDGKIVGEVQYIRFYRAISTGDAYDIAFQNQVQPIIWCRGPGTARSPGEHPRGAYGYANINFLQGAVYTPPASPSPSPSASPSPSSSAVSPSPSAASSPSPSPSSASSPSPSPSSSALANASPSPSPSSTSPSPTTTDSSSTNVLILPIASNTNSSLQSTLGGSVTFDSQMSLQWNLSTTLPSSSSAFTPATSAATAKYIVFTMTLQSQDIYGSFGVGEVMDGADMLFASVDTTNGGQVGDRMGSGHDDPFLDTSRGGTDDAHLLDASISNGVQTIRFYRAVVTGDKYDLDFTNEVQTLIWCWGPGPAFSPGIHPRGAYGTAQINFLQGVAVGVTRDASGKGSTVFLVIAIICVILLFLGTFVTWRMRCNYPQFQSFLYQPLYQPLDSDGLLAYFLNPICGLTKGSAVFVLLWAVALGTFVAWECAGDDLWVGFGEAAFFPMAFLLFPILRKSPLSRMLGTSLERSVKYHRSIGWIFFILVTVHGAGMTYKKQDEVLQWSGQRNNLAGVIAWAAMVVIILTSLPIVRRKCWEVFYYSHIILFVVIIVFAALHAVGAFFAIIASLAFMVPELIYRIYRVFCQVGTVKIINDVPKDGLLCVEISTKTPMEFKPGQYVFLNYPKYSKFQWHPFTLVPTPVIGNSPDPSSFQLLIKSNGPESFTGALLEHLRVNDTVLLDGPFGSLTFPVEQHNTVILIGGGIGATPMLCLLDALTSTDLPGRSYNASNGSLPDRQHRDSPPFASATHSRRSFSLPFPRRIILILSARTRSAMNLFLPHLSTAVARNNPTVELEFHLHITGKTTRGKETNSTRVMEMVATSPKISTPTPAPTVCSSPAQANIPAPVLVAGNVKPQRAQHPGARPVIHSPFPQQPTTTAVGWDAMEDAAFPARFGRPDYRLLLNQQMTYALQRGETSLAACVCGPAELMDGVETAVYDLNAADRGAAILLHREAFEF